MKELSIKVIEMQLITETLHPVCVYIYINVCMDVCIAVYIHT